MSKRVNANYEIIAAIPIDHTHEIVIGHNPSAPAPYVCWNCRNTDDYSDGGYCSTYRQALYVMSERIQRRYEFIPVEF